MTYRDNNDVNRLERLEAQVSFRAVETQLQIERDRRGSK